MAVVMCVCVFCNTSRELAFTYVDENNNML
jgi:hypothetical protein